MPPKEVLYKIKKRILINNKNQYDLNEIGNSHKHMRPGRLDGFLNNIQMILRRNHVWSDIEFNEKYVLEIGSGPLLGFGPLAVFLGCKKYVCAEPQFNREVLQSKFISEKYFFPMYKNLCALNGEKMTFAAFIKTLQTDIFVEDKRLLQCKFANKFDIILSKSCLEHIFPLNKSLKYLRDITKENVRFIHVVDFGNHMKTQNPFIHIYENTPEYFYKRFGRTINLYRPSDVLAMLENNGFEATMTPYCSFKEFYNKPIHSYWTERYNEEELFLKSVIFTGAVS
jgi:SAM-dependent methyltransferase